jgi:hypothetical protein
MAGILRFETAHATTVRWQDSVMRTIGFVLVLAACGGGSGGGDVWDARVNDFAQAICVNACVPAEDQEACLVDVVADMDQARIAVGPGGEATCLDCIRVITDLIPAVAANGCQPTPDQDAQVLAACDPNPAFDFDGDGDPGNDFDEACEGFP